MKTRTIIVAVACAIAAAPAARAQFMSIAGLPGEVKDPGREDTHELALYSHAVQIPIDPGSGQATGVRVHSPIVIKKKFNRSSPNLYKACTNGENIPSVEFTFYRVDSRGTEVEYYTILLEDVKVVSFANGPTGAEDSFANPDEFPVLEDLSLTYRRITWTYVEGGIEHTDDWIAARKTAEGVETTPIERISSAEGTSVRFAAARSDLSIRAPDGSSVEWYESGDDAVARVALSGFYSYTDGMRGRGHFFVQ